MEKTLISPEDSWTLWTILLGFAALSIALVERYRWAAKISGPVIVIFAGMGLASTHVIPKESPVYENVWGFVVPVAVALLLFRADVRRIWREAGRTFGAFHVSALGTVLGAFAAGLLFATTIDHAPGIAAMMTGSYVGGSVNFVALAAIYRPPEALVNSTVVADNLVMALYFFVLLALPSVAFLKRHFETPFEDAARRNERAYAGSSPVSAPKRPISLLDMAVVLALAVGVAAVSTKLATVLSADSMPGVVRLLFGQKYLLITTFAVLLATLFPRAVGGRGGSEELGTLLIYLFFFAIGAPADVPTVLTQSPRLIFFCAVIVLANMLVTLALGRVFRFKLEELLIASNANIGGPMTAAAMAVAKGWDALVLPGMLVGIWGYVIGNYVGMFVGKTLMALAPG